MKTTRREWRERHRILRSALRDMRISGAFVVSEERIPSLYAHMLAEDVGLGVVPGGGHSKHADFSVNIAPPDPDVERLIIDGLGNAYWCRSARGQRL